MLYRTVRTEELHPGMIVVDPVYAPASDVALAVPGTSLSPRLIELFQHWEVDYIRVQTQLPPVDRECVNLVYAVQNSVKQVYKDLAENRAPEIRVFSKSIEDVINNIFGQGSERMAQALCLIDRHESYTFQHSLEVGLGSVLVGYHMGYEREQIKDLAIGALLHDVGKIMIPATILQKPSQLNNREWDIMREHPQLGYQVLKDVGIINEHILAIPLEHHERMDGDGYPRGVKSESLHPYGRLASVCDVFFALTSNRAYRQAWCPFKTMEYLHSSCRTAFDDKLVQNFVKAVATSVLRGMEVRLNTGETGFIVAVEQDHPMRPTIFIERDSMGQIIPGRLIELTENPTVFVEKVFERPRLQRHSAS